MSGNNNRFNIRDDISVFFYVITKLLVYFLLNVPFFIPLYLSISYTSIDPVDFLLNCGEIAKVRTTKLVTL